MKELIQYLKRSLITTDARCENGQSGINFCSLTVPVIKEQLEELKKITAEEEKKYTKKELQKIIKEEE